MLVECFNCLHVVALLDVRDRSLDFLDSLDSLDSLGLLGQSWSPGRLGYVSWYSTHETGHVVDEYNDEQVHQILMRVSDN